MNITTPTGVETEVNLEKGFEEYVFYASAEPYNAITCKGVMISWVSLKVGVVKSCEPEGTEILVSSTFSDLSKLFGNV